MDKSQLFWKNYTQLEEDVINISKYVYITDNKRYINDEKEVCNEYNEDQLKIYSPKIADALIRICVEIETISKEIYFNNGGTKTRGSKDIYFDTDCIDLIVKKFNADKKAVLVSYIDFELYGSDNIELYPLYKANERSKTYWAKAYQAVKHDRYNCLYFGNIKAMITALAALYLLNMYMKNVKVTGTYNALEKYDMSFGSKVFTIPAPIINSNLWYENRIETNNSIFTVRYPDNIYEKIVTGQKNDQDNINNFIEKQPEIKDENFLKHISEMLENGNKNIILLWEIFKYRLNKKIPTTLPFPERKKLLIESNEWKFNRIRLANSPKKPNEITEDNIQEEINKLGTCEGIQMNQVLSNSNWFALTDTPYCEMLLETNSDFKPQ